MVSPALNTPTEFPVHGIFDNTRLCKGVVQNLLSGAVDIIMTYMITNDGLGLLRPLHPPLPMCIRPKKFLVHVDSSTIPAHPAPECVQDV